MTILSVVLGIGLLANAGPNEAAKAPALRLLLSEVQPGSMASEHYCMLVFDNHRFHAERAQSRGKTRSGTTTKFDRTRVDWQAEIDLCACRDKCA